jgi:hypothetical protein
MVSLSGIVAGNSPVIDDVGGVVDHDSSRANLWDVTKRAKVEHSFGYVAREFFNLFSDVAKEGVARPSTH